MPHGQEQSVGTGAARPRLQAHTRQGAPRASAPGEESARRHLHHHDGPSCLGADAPADCRAPGRLNASGGGVPTIAGAALCHATRDSSDEPSGALPAYVEKRAAAARCGLEAEGGPLCQDKPAHSSGSPRSRLDDGCCYDRHRQHVAAEERAPSRLDGDGRERPRVGP
eukprot:scaffold15721_cov112-Isochrysis_galbana.AAC.3